MVKGGHGQLHDINWGAFDHTSRASQLRSCIYNNLCECLWECVIIFVEICVSACVYNNIIMLVCVKLFM